jgi:hypothetical protein
MTVVNVLGDVSQVIAELMASAVDCANDCSRNSRSVKREVSERDDIIVAAMIEEDARDVGKLPGNVARQLEIVEIPITFIP